MKLKQVKLGDLKVWPFTIPSGIITTQVSSLAKLAREIPELGILTTKSIGPEPREGNREPILGQYAPGCFVNAVGLTNPGAEEFARQLKDSGFPEDKFLLASIFGKNSSEFVHVIKTLEDYVDGFELNLSCPHAQGYGMQLGEDVASVYNITRSARGATNKPIFAKLTPNVKKHLGVKDVGDIAHAAITGGAKGITAINTVGPGYYSVDGKPVLTNEVGGLSGRGITPIGLKSVRDVRKEIGEKVPIIGVGGIRTVEDVEGYEAAGANIFGIGSALAGMTDANIRDYFAALVGDIRSNNWTNNASLHLKQVDMKYQKAIITGKRNLASDFKVFTTDTRIPRAEPGQFFFVWIPGVGEKPFSIMDDEPFRMVVQERGEFTRALNKLKRGDSFYIRGPYGSGVDLGGGHARHVLVGGGSGIAGLPM